jgi:hypothetical protein
LNVLKLQAIGSEVAAEISRSAEMNVPAKIVAVSRAEVKVVNIGNPLDIWRPDHRAMPNTLHGACQFKIVVIFQ